MEKKATRKLKVNSSNILLGYKRDLRSKNCKVMRSKDSESITYQQLCAVARETLRGEFTAFLSFTGK